MHIQKIFHRGAQNNSKSSNIYQNNPLLKHDLKVSFKGQKDVFERQSTETFLRQVQEDLKKISLEMSTHREYKTPREEMLALEDRNTRLATIKGQYKLIDDALNSYKNPNEDKNIKSIFNFIIAMNKLDKDKGFGRIIGTTYNGIKQNLMDEFVLQTVGKAKFSQEVTVPNALFFYGPSGTGKTTFARALAEQTCSNIDLLDAGRLSPKDALILLKQKALMAKQNYEKSGTDKKRTFIILNEADVIAQRGSETSSDFIKFAQDCSDKYKCTLFLTTNNPLDIAPEILSDKITSIKVALLPADEESVRELTEYTLKRFNQKLEHVDKMVEAFLSNKNYFYSNSNIVKTIEEACTQKENTNILKNFIAALDNCIPSIPKRVLSSFPKNNEELLKMAKKIK